MKKVHLFNSFVGSSSNSGNPAGIVYNQNLSEKEMQNIASQVGLSETVFIEKHNDFFRFRFFTPVAEVDLCGHATIASAAFLFQNQSCSFPINVQTKAGKIKLFQEKNCFFMEQPLPRFGKKIDYSLIAESLNSDVHIFPADFQPQIVSTGLPDLIIPIATSAILHKIKPNFAKIATISNNFNLVGYHLFAFAKEKKVYCRNFAPLFGINEEAATGTANGALACYLFQNGMQKEEYVFEQGNAMGKPSLIFVKISSKNNQISSVLVGGKVKFYKALPIK